jgi:hypothetical protein
VKVFDEFEYVCKPGDTFASISKQYLESENYAKALQRHNMNHARASEQMHNTGQLKPGEKIYIPPTSVLEDRYADTIPRPTPSSSPSATMPATFVTPSASPPIPAPQPPPAPGAPTTSSPPPNP